MMKKEESHPAYGIVGINRVSGYNNLVGSEVSHLHFFELRIREATRIDEDGQIRYSAAGGKVLAVIQLSPSQFVDMITSTNVGDGIPCTLRYINGDETHSRPRIEPEPSRIQKARDWSLEKSKARRESANAQIKELEGMISSLSGKKQAEVMKIVRSISEYFDVNSDFFEEKITEATEKSVEIAKVEIEAHVQSVVRALGISSLQSLDEALKNKDLTIEEGK